MTDKILIDRSVVEQALEALEADNSKLWPSEKRAAAITFLRERLEQPQVEQEPVAWIENIGGGIGYNPYHDAARKLPDGVRFDLYTHPQNLNCKSNQARLATLWGYEKPQPPRQPLTDEELRDALRSCPRDTVENLRVRWLYAKDFARAIEAAHGIKEQK